MGRKIISDSCSVLLISFFGMAPPVRVLLLLLLSPSVVQFHNVGVAGLPLASPPWGPSPGSLSPLHLSPLHLSPLHLSPLHLGPLDLGPMYLSPKCRRFIIIRHHYKTSL